MSKLQLIENALLSINQAAFQNLCDSFLALRNSNYSAFSRTGSQTGKQKTVKGTPDTFLLLPNGKYIFVEYSTNISAGVSKLEDDIKKCIDTKKTGIPLNQIAEIILCVNFNLPTTEIQALKNLLVKTRIQLTIYTLDALAIELHLHHRDIVHEYLGLPLDTGQIVSIEKFITEYNRASKGIATPLDNTFLHRENELKELKEVISQNDFIILTGAPGIGKTKLALEGVNSFLSENLSYTAYCVSYKNHTLLDDLYQYFDSEKDYILFVDDANRIDAFSQIIGFYKSSRKGKLKILITVRDYAYQDIGILCQEYSPKRVDLKKFSDEQIIDIIKAKPFEILNSDYHKPIVSISDGNPRLAIMTAQLAKDRQNIYVLHDVSELFEKYFSTFVKDNGEFANTLNIKCLGLIAFFYTIPYKNKEITTPILENFDIGYSEFIDAIDVLEKLELVELQFEHVKIPEQNLSTYFFYKAFIKDNVLSFDTLLKRCFYSNSNRFRDCVVPANNTFGSNNVMEKLQPYLKNHLKEIESEKEKAFKFFSIFWFYLQTETLEFILNLVNALASVPSPKYSINDSENNSVFDKSDKVIELLSEFFRFHINLKDAIELSFEYVKKKPEQLSELIHKIRERLPFDKEDYQWNFQRQEILFQVLFDGLRKFDSLLAVAFYELSKTFLAFQFHHTKGGRNHSIYWYDYPVPNIPAIHNFRRQIWEAVNINFEQHPDESFNLLLSYSSVRPDVLKEIMEFDTPYIIEIIEKCLTVDSFEHCKYVQEYIRWCKRSSVTHPSFTSLAQNFTNPTYEIFLKLDWDRLRDKDSFDFENYKVYEKLKEQEIRSSFVFQNISEVKDFYTTFTDLKDASNNEWRYNTTLDFIIDENCSKNFDLGCLLIEEVIEHNNEVGYIPRIVFSNHLTEPQKTNKIWDIIQKKDFRYKEQWELSFYDYLVDELITEDYCKALVNTINSMEGSNTIFLGRLQRFLAIEPNLFQTILEIIFKKNKQEGTQLQVWNDFFTTYFGQLGDDLKLIKAVYIQQHNIQSHFDFDGKGFLNILKLDTSFLYEYVDGLYSESEFRF